MRSNMKYIMVNQSSRRSRVSINEHLSTEIIHIMEHYHKCIEILKRQMEPVICIMESVSIIIHQKDSQLYIMFNQNKKRSQCVSMRMCP